MNKGSVFDLTVVVQVDPLRVRQSGERPGELDVNSGCWFDLRLRVLLFQAPYCLLQADLGWSTPMSSKNGGKSCCVVLSDRIDAFFVALN
jgi:hypothetical protein